MSDEYDLKLASLLNDLTERAQNGEAIELEQACRDHPRFASDLRELWGAVQIADAAGSWDAETHSPSDLVAEVGFELPARWGDYELLEEIGRGGMGVVYRARQHSLNRSVAVKMLVGGELASAEDLERFRAEAESAARLDSPGIVPVYEVGLFGGRPFFSMKYIAGETLSQRLVAGPLPPREAATILRQVCLAVQDAHEQGVLHRDLKPSNILIDSDGEPHVTDFGLAKQVSDAVTLTRTGAVLGTPAYMAPEQAAGRRGKMSVTSDVYSLGAILYHMLTGRPPFQAASPLETLLLVQAEQDPPHPKVMNPHVDRRLAQICVRCLQKPPDLRYDTAQALADELNAFLNDEPISASSGRFADVISRMFRETHNAILLENWGVLWMWHSLVIFTACACTNIMQLVGVTNRWYYVVLWTLGFWTWAGVFWALRRRMGPVTFVERQIAHLWMGSMISITMLFPLEQRLNLEVLSLSPVLGLISGMVFIVKAGILSGAFYLQAAVCFSTAIIMALVPNYAHFLFGSVSAACFFFPGLKYYRQREAGPL